MELYDYFRSEILARGYNYFKKGFVRKIEKLSDTQYKSEVIGTHTYHVYIDLEKPEKCTCTCPYNKHLCKHIAATYLAVKPNDLKVFEDALKCVIKMRNDYYQRNQKRTIEDYKEAKRYVDSLSDDEIRTKFVNFIVHNQYEDKYEYDEEIEEEIEVLDEIDDEFIDAIEERIKPYLSEFVNAFEFISEDDSWINIKTCEVYTMEDFDIMNLDGDEIDEFISESDIYELPSRYELNEYGDMLTFAKSQSDEKTKQVLLKSLNGKGAFSRFKAEIANLNLRNEWFKYKDKMLKEKVLKWLLDNNIEYKNDLN